MSNNIEVKNTQNQTESKDIQKVDLVKTKNDILKIINNGRRRIDTTPKYIKPAFFLDSLTPYLKVKIVLPVETYDNYVKYETIDLFDSEEESTNNHLKSFKYDLLQQDEGGGVTIVFSSVDQEIIEFLSIRFAYLEQGYETVKLKIEFGWSVSDTIKKQYEGVISFTNYIDAVLRTMTPVFNKDGSVEVTLTATVDKLLPPPFDNYLPGMIIGINPGMTIGVLHIFNNLNKLKTFKKDTNVIDEITTISKIIRFCYINNLTKDLNILVDLCKSAIEYYGGSNSINTEKHIKKILKQLGQQKNTNIVYKQEIISYDNMATTLKNALSIEQNSNQFNAKQLINNIKDNNNLQFKRYIEYITIVAKDMLIHPYIVWEYVKDNFEKGFKQMGYQNIIIPILKTISMVNVENIKPNNYLTYDNSGKIQINQSVFDNLTAPEKEVYGYPASKYEYSLSTSWFSIFNELDNMMYISFIPPQNKNDINEIKKVIEGIEVPKPQKTGTNQKSDPNEIVLKMKSSILFLGPDSAYANINLLSNLVQKLNPNINIKNEINSLKAFLNSNRNNDKKDIILYIRDLIASNEIFNPELGNNQIMQTYSFNVAGDINSSKDNYNPGFPTVWDVNFPDVLDFSANLDYMTKIKGLKINKDAQVNMQTGMQKIQNKDTQKELPNESIYIRNYKQHNPITFNLDFTKRDTYHGDYANSMMMKKNIQNFRKYILLNNDSFTCNLRVLGDPSYVLHSLDKYIFIKYILQDGSLSFYTGVYKIMKVLHEIFPGRFETNIEIMHDPSALDENYSKQLVEAIYKQDRLKVTIEE